MDTIIVYIWLMMLLVVTAGGQLVAQQASVYDSTYIEAYPEQIIGRIFFSRKFTGFQVAYDGLGDQVLKYEPNTTKNLGIGASYRWFTLNLAYGFDFLNQNDEQGKTKYLDLQSHLYLGKFNVDLLGQFYKGYFLENLKSPDGVTYVRPDLGVTQLGASGQYVFNHEKFSFKAAFQNTELQKRSAGSWLMGWNMFYGSVTADSSLVPGFLQSETPDYDRLRFLKAGPVVGYAYTLVMLEKFYLSGAADLAISCGMYSLKLDRAKFEEFYVSVDYGLRFAAGYNTSRLNIGAFYVVQKVQVESNYHNIISTGNFRFIVAYRFAKKHIAIFD